MKKIGLCFLAIFLMFGCASVGNKQITNDELISQIKIGETTKPEVKQKIGEPTKVTFTDNNEEIWEYVYTHSQMRAASLVPVVSIFAGGADVDTQTLTIRFNKEGQVKEIGKGRSTGGGGSVLD